MKTSLISFWSMATGSAVADTHYVDGNSLAPSAPHTNWRSAAMNVQNAIEVSAPADEVARFYA